MIDGYIEIRNNRNIRPVIFPNKEKIFDDLINIEHSWSGRDDIWSTGNQFIMEAEQQLINAIELFEQGYFDCAYYSMRSAVDLSTTLVFLADMPNEERKKYLDAWKDTKYFPMRIKIIELLSQNGDIYRDMRDKMPGFFCEEKKLSAELNKYVHKQGFEHFYVSRNHPLNINKSLNGFIKKFEYHLKRCIGVVAVMRLAIDPFPILLMNEEILYRCYDSMTDPYSKAFVDEYIDQNTIDDYKKTEIYCSAYKSLIGEQRKTEATFNVVKHQYIDSLKMDELLKQLPLMSKDDIVCVLMVYACNKVVKTYCKDGLLMYFTERNSNRKVMSWSMLDFIKFAEAENKINQAYDDVYISVFSFENELYYIEHNEPIDNEDIAHIFGVVTGALFKINELFKEES